MNRFHVLLHKSSGGIAKDRIKTVILSDRLNCSPEVTTQIKREIVYVLSKYLELDNADIKIHLDITKKIGQGVRNVKTIQIKGL